MDLVDSLVRTMRQACATLDRELSVVHFNAEFSRIFSEEGASPRGARFLELWQADDRQTLHNLLDRIAAGDGAIETVSARPGWAGRVAEVRLSARAVHDDLGRVAFLITAEPGPDDGAPSALGLETTETASSDDSDDDRWHLTGRIAGANQSGGEAGIFTWDLVTGDVTVSTSLMRQLGYELDAIGDPMAFFTSIYHPDDLAGFDAVLNEAISEKKPYRTQIRLRASDGRYRHFLLRGQPVQDASGAVVMMIGTETDITEQVELNEQFLRAEEIAQIGNWSSELKDGQMYWSPGMYRIFGWEEGVTAPTMEKVRAALHPDDRDLVENMQKRLLHRWRRLPGATERFRARVHRPDGMTRHIEATALIEAGATGEPSRILGVTQDITDLVQAEESLLASQKMEVIGKLAGGAAHDFNNLLAVIMGNLELVDVNRDPSEWKGFIENALGATSRGASLTRNLLSFARQAILNPKRLDLNRTTSDMLAMLRRVLPENIRIEVKEGESLWSVHADQASFENAVLNLAINARDAMSNGGVITIETENRMLTETDIEERQETLSPGPHVVFSLSDTGAGIPPELLLEVFTPYFTTKPIELGSGLGLSMAHGFMRQSGGGLRLYSEIGVGTTVKLYFPATALDPPIEVEETPEAPAPAVSGRALLVEDNDDVRFVLERRLTAMGVDCAVAASGDEAVDVFERSGPFDLLVTDVVMPGVLQGPDLARALRRIQPTLKVIFITGYPNEAVIHGNGLMQEDIRLMKPISKVDLARAINDLMNDRPE